MPDKRQISIRKINKDRDYIIKNQLKGRRLVYVFEPKEEINLDLKKNLMFAGFLPSTYKDKNEMINDALQLQPPEVFFISTINKAHYEIIKEIKSNKELSHIFVIAASLYKNSAEKAYEAGAEFYIPMPYVFKRLKYLIRALTFINDMRYSENSNLKNDFKINFSGKGETIVEIKF
jgi:DNA-binding NtrC family response regulator